MPAWICPSSVSTIPSLPWERLDHEPREITAACLLPDGSDTPGLLDSTRYHPTMDCAARTGCFGGRTMASTTQADVGSHHRRCSGERPGHKQLSPGHRLRSTLPAVLLPPRTNALLRRHRSHQAEDCRRAGLPRQHCVAGATRHTRRRRRRRLDHRAVTPRPAGTAACGNRRGSAEVSAAAGTGCHHPDRGHGSGDVIAGRDGPVQRIDCPESTGLPVWPSYRRRLHHKTPYHELVEALAGRCDESPRLLVDADFTRRRAPDSRRFPSGGSTHDPACLDIPGSCPPAGTGKVSAETCACPPPAVRHGLRLPRSHKHAQQDSEHADVWPFFALDHRGETSGAAYLADVPCAQVEGQSLPIFCRHSVAARPAQPVYPGSALLRRHVCSAGIRNAVGPSRGYWAQA